MTKKQELIIRIKEVKELTRDLTIEEESMYLFSNDKTPTYSMVIYRAQQKLKEIGLVGVCRLNGDGISVGLFRIETIRDATLEEINAWHILELDKIRCKRAYSNNIELTTRPDNKEFEKLLLDKEIIFEVSP